MLVYLTRHGQTISNADDRVAGSLDVDLSDAGRTQAERLASAVSHFTFDAVFTSQLDRTIQTVRPLLRRSGTPHVSLSELNEINLGCLEGRFRDERDPEAAAMWAQRQAALATFRPPGGESFSDLQKRVRRALATIRYIAAHGVILIVGHRNVNRALLSELLGMPLVDAFEFRPRANRLVKLTDHSSQSNSPLVEVFKITDHGKLQLDNKSGRLLHECRSLG